MFGGGGGGGGGGSRSKDAPKNAILGLRSTLEMLTKREKHLQNQMDDQDAIARKSVSTNKASEWHAISPSCCTKKGGEELTRCNV